MQSGNKCQIHGYVMVFVLFLFGFGFCLFLYFETWSDCVVEADYELISFLLPLLKSWIIGMDFYIRLYFLLFVDVMHCNTFDF